MHENIFHILLIIIFSQSALQSKNLHLEELFPLRNGALYICLCSQNKTFKRQSSDDYTQCHLRVSDKTMLSIKLKIWVLYVSPSTFDWNIKYYIILLAEIKGMLKFDNPFLATSRNHEISTTRRGFKREPPNRNYKNKNTESHQMRQVNKLEGSETWFRFLKIKIVTGCDT